MNKCDFAIKAAIEVETERMEQLKRIREGHKQKQIQALKGKNEEPQVEEAEDTFQNLTRDEKFQSLKESIRQSFSKRGSLI